jgi:cell division protein ZipA
MPELRIILLVLGVLFVAAIAGFEWWRSRGQKPAAAVGSRGSARMEDRGSARMDERGSARMEDRGSARNEDRGSPRIDERANSRDDRTDSSADAPREKRPLPEINIVREAHVSVDDDLPVIELASTSESGTRRALGISISNEVAVDMSDSHTPPKTEPRARTEPFLAAHVELSEVRVIDEVPAQAPQITLNWPPDNERRIVTLRVMPRSEPRFAGRALRQAFSGCGFWHGPLDIYHLPDEKGRVLLSAAALAQPGTFDPSIMDSQRFSGINLFAVLPSVMPERELFEELIHAARQLAERLSGMVADQHGEELTAARITRLRQSLEATPATRAPDEA